MVDDEKGNCIEKEKHKENTSKNSATLTFCAIKIREKKIIDLQCVCVGWWDGNREKSVRISWSKTSEWRW